MSRARLELEADSRQVRTATSDLENLNRTGEQSTAMATNLRRAVVALGGALSVRAIQQYTSSTAAATDEQAKFAQAIGVSFEQLQRLQFTARQNGGTNEALSNSLRRLTRRTEEAAQGTGAAVQAFRTLGLDAKELQNLSPDEIFLRVADSFKELTTDGERVRTAFGLFDTEGAKLINTLRQGRAVIEETGQSLNNVVSDEAAHRAADYNDQVDRLQTELAGLGATVSSALLPRMTELASSLADLLGDSEKVDSIMKTLGTSATVLAAIFGARLTGSIAASTTALLAKTAAMNAATIASRTLSASMALLGGPVGVVTLAATALVFFTSESRKARAESEALDGEISSLVNSFQQLNDQGRALTFTKLESEASGLRDRQRELADEIERLDQKYRDAAKSGGQFAGISEFAALSRAQAAYAETSKELDAISEKQQALFALGIPEKWEEIAGATNDAATATGLLSDSYLKVTGALQEQFIELTAGADELERYRLITALGTDATDEQVQTIDLLLGRLRELRAERAAAEEQARAQAEAEREFNRVQAELATVGMSPAEIARQQYEARLDVIREYTEQEDADRTAAHEAGILAEQAYQEELTRIAEAEAARRRASNEAMLSATGDVLGKFADIAKEGGRDSFNAYKVLASGQAIMSAAVAINRALAEGGPFLGPALAAGIAGLTGVQIAKISQQQYSPRAVGGQVRDGQNYLVGERGPELITMRGNGTVTPNSQLRQQGGQQELKLNLNVHNYGPDGELQSVRSEQLTVDQARQVVEIVTGNIRERGRIHSAFNETTTSGNRL